MLNFEVLKKRIMQFLKSEKLYSIITGKCPVCHKGEMYLEKNPYKISKIMEMHDHCSNCGKKFKIEPSFFEMTVGLAFNYFVSQQIDIAIIEVGLGGQLNLSIKL